MLRLYFLLFSLFLFVQLPMAAQVNTGSCEDAYRTAKRHYEKGQLNKIAWLLNDCYETEGLDRSLRKKILVLLAETYKHLEEEESALKKYEELLRLDPFFEPSASNYELLSLDKKLIRYTKTSVGVYGGAIVNLDAMVLEQNKPANTNILSEEYLLDTTGRNSWNTTVFIDYRPFEKSNIDVTASIGFTTLQYNYNARYDDGMTGKSVSLYEKMDRIALGVGINYTFINRTKVIKTSLVPYIYGRIGTTVLLPSSRINSAQYYSAFKTIINNRSVRRSVNMQAEVGAGVKIKLTPRWYVQPSASYTYWQGSLTKRSNEAPDFFVNNNYVDNDYSLGFWQLSIGGGFFLYKSGRK